jgi:hypothetical protein
LGGSTVGETVDDRIKIQNDLNNLKKKSLKKKAIKRPVSGSVFRFITAWDMDMAQNWEGCQVNMTTASGLGPLVGKCGKSQAEEDHLEGAPADQILKKSEQ